MDKENIYKIPIITIKFFWKIIKYFFKVLGYILEPILEYAIPLFALLFILSLPFAIIGALIDYFKSDFESDTSDIIQVIIKISHDAYTIMMKFISEHPNESIVIGVFLLILIIKSLLSGILVRKSSYRSLLRGMFYFLITILLIVVIVFYENVSTELNSQINYMNNFFYQYFNQKININITKNDLVFILIINVVMWVNNRLVWILSVFTFQIFLIYVFYVDIIDWFSQFPNEYIRVLQGILPLFIIAPYVFIVWIFRDNDKFMEYSLKKEEINIKKKEIRIRENELSNKRKELELKKRELYLKSKNHTIKG